MSCYPEHLYFVNPRFSKKTINSSKLKKCHLIKKKSTQNYIILQNFSVLNPSTANQATIQPNKQTNKTNK